MLAEITAVIATVKSLMDGLQSARNTAGDFHALVNRWVKAEDSLQKLELKQPIMDVEASLKVQIAKKQLITFQRQLKDALYMQNMASDFNEIMQRVEDSKKEHARRVAQAKRKRLRTIKLIKEIATYTTVSTIIFGLAMGGVYIFVKFF